MKGLTEYLNTNKVENIFSLIEEYKTYSSEEAFESVENYILTNRLNESQNPENMINEGFWDFLTSFFKSIFGDGVSKETQEHVTSGMDWMVKEYGKSMTPDIKKIFKQKSSKKTLKTLETIRKKYLKNNEFDSEEESYAWAANILEYKLEAMEDSGADKDEIAAIEKAIKDYESMAGDESDTMRNNINNKTHDDGDGDNTENSQISPEFEKGMNQSIETYESVYKVLCNDINLSIDGLKAAVEAIIVLDKPTKLSIIDLGADKDAIFGLMLMCAGGYKVAETEQSKEMKNVINHIIGMLAVLIENNSLK